MPPTSSPYIPLPNPADYIRLVELAPGQLDDELVGTFHVYKLGDAHPGYTATSYVCGDDDRSRHHILMSGVKLGIYRNADQLLRRFRSTATAVYLFCDVICIDQDDPVAKGNEVSYGMYRVYQHSSRTVVWFGPIDTHAEIAIRFARTLDAAAYLEEFLPTVQYAGHETQYMQSKSHILDFLATRPQTESLINSCARFLLRPYFTRVWTQQECAMSPHPVVVCGDEEIAWEQIFALAWLFVPRNTMTWPVWFMSDRSDQGYAQLEPNLMFITSVQRFRLRQKLRDEHASITTAYSLVNVMRSASQQKCFDPRDKIYALRNIATDLQLEDWAPKPDYVTPWEDVYTEFGARMAARGDSSLLAWSGLSQQEKNSGLPSWAVDWRSFPRTQYINHEEWSAGSRTFRAKVEPIPKKRRQHLMKLAQATDRPRTALRYSLHVTVAMQDDISFLSGALESWKSFGDVERLHSDVQAIDQANQSVIVALPYARYINSEPLLDAYDATLIASTTDSDALAPESYVSHGAREWRAWLASGASTQPATAVPKFHDAIDNMDTFQYKRFCVTSHGYFCLVPDLTQSTDVVAIVKGLEMPVVLRPAAGGKDVGGPFVYVGQSYVHGMMQLQAGTLIEEFRCKVREGKVVVDRPEGEVRRNGLKMEAGEYVRILPTLGESKVELI